MCVFGSPNKTISEAFLVVVVVLGFIVGRYLFPFQLQRIIRGRKQEHHISLHHHHHHHCFHGVMGLFVLRSPPFLLAFASVGFVKWWSTTGNPSLFADAMICEEGSLVTEVPTSLF